MASKPLALSSPELLAEYVRESELKGFFEKRLAAPPDHMAMLIRNGEIIDTYKGAHFSVGGILRALKSLVIGSQHVSILLSDLKPFSVQTPLKAITKDDVQVDALATLELQVNPDQPKNVMGLVNTSGFLTHDEVLRRFKPHLTDRVVEAAVRRVKADELRGERGLQDHIQAEIMREVERVAGDLGLLVRVVSLEWAINDVEREAMQKAALDREQTRLDNELEYLKRNIQRGADSTVFQIQTDLDVAKVQNATEEELEHMALNREIRLHDARVAAERRQDLEGLQHEVEMIRGERLARFEGRIAEADNLVDVAQRRMKLARANAEIDAITRTHQMQMKKLEAMAEIEISRASQGAQVDHLKALQDLEQSGEDKELTRRLREKESDAQITLNQTKADADAKVAELQAASIMTPEQILAVNAGLSADVANVLVEQARASAQGNEQVMTVMREMVTQATQAKVASEEQAREMFRMGMQGAGAVASGAGGGRAVAGTVSADATVECPKCGRENDVKSRHCIGCGYQLRK